MVVIGYDRYNVIVKGFSGPKIGPGMVSTKITIKKVYLNECCRNIEGLKRFDMWPFSMHDHSE